MDTTSTAATRRLGLCSTHQQGRRAEGSRVRGEGPASSPHPVCPQHAGEAWGDHPIKQTGSVCHHARPGSPASPPARLILKPRNKHSHCPPLPPQAPAALRCPHMSPAASREHSTESSEHWPVLSGSLPGAPGVSSILDSWVPALWTVGSKQGQWAVSSGQQEVGSGGGGVVWLPAQHLAQRRWGTGTGQQGCARPLTAHTRAFVCAGHRLPW